MLKKSSTVIFCLLICISSSSQIPQETNDLSENYHPNLKNVLNHYKTTGEHEKFQAALFLIENMCE